MSSGMICGVVDADTMSKKIMNIVNEEIKHNN